MEELGKASLCLGVHSFVCFLWAAVEEEGTPTKVIKLEMESIAMKRIAMDQFY